MRIIPKNTRVAIEFFKGVELPDVLVGLVGVSIIVFVFMSNIGGKLWLMLGLTLLFGMLIVKIDADKTYVLLLYFLRHLAYKKRFAKMQPPDGLEYVYEDDDESYPKKGKAKNKNTKIIKSGKKDFSDYDIPITMKEKAASLKKKAAKKAVKEFDIRGITPFTKIDDGLIHYGREYYASVLEIKPVEFQYFNAYKQNNLIDRVFGSVLRNVTGAESACLIKIDRPIIFDAFIADEFKKVDHIKQSYLNGLITEEELTTRVGILYGRIEELDFWNAEKKINKSFYYLVIFDESAQLLKEQAYSAASVLETNEISCKILDDRELALFLKYQYTREFDEHEIDSIPKERYIDWILPEKLEIRSRTVVIDDIVTHNLRVSEYPNTVLNAWGINLFDIPDTKVVMKLHPVEKFKAIRRIDRAIDELRGQSETTGKTSRLIELQQHVDTLSEVLTLLQNDNETLFEVNIYITIYEYKDEDEAEARMPGASKKKSIRRMLNEESLRTEDMFMQQFEAFVGGGVTARDSAITKSRSIHSTSVAAAFPFAVAALEDTGGINFGYSRGLPVFLNFFKRDDKRINSNMVIIGKSGSGKSYATKTMLSNLSAEDAKVFILDPENEYSGIAAKMNGKVIDVGSAKQGRLNPFHMVASVDEEDEEEGGAASSYIAHLQFLEEFFRQILPDINPDALEQLNNLIVRMYEMKGIDADTDLSRLGPEDFPTFDDLYDKILTDFQSTTGDYSKINLRTLLNYVSKFATGGRNSALWNGHASITTNENFVVFNFQSLLANKNNTIANAQMLLVLKWLDNEIIKNRDYNLKYKASRKIIIVVDEAHVFIDVKYPIALDFMFQLAKRIRKYNGMQIIITQNIKDFVGSEEIARKSTAIINACQYSFIFPLAPNDMHDLCRLYEKAGEINEIEQEQIVNNPRGSAFVVTSPTSRTCIQIVASPEVSALF